MNSPSPPAPSAFKRQNAVSAEAVLQTSPSPLQNEQSDRAQKGQLIMLSPSPSPGSEVAAEVYRSPTPLDQSIKADYPDMRLGHEQHIGKTQTEMVSASALQKTQDSGYKSPPPLPRLVTRTSPLLAEISPTSSGGSSSKSLPGGAVYRHSRLPALFKVKANEAKTVRDFYPTPVSIGERERVRWPVAGDRTRDRPTGTRQSGTTRSSPIMSRTNSISPEREGLTLKGPTNRTYPAISYPHVYPVQNQAPHGIYPSRRPRLSIHPYMPGSPVDGRYYSANPLPNRPPSNPAFERGWSPATTSSVSPSSFKAPRKRADDIQLSVLNEVFEWTSYPSTEKREDLARRLGMTSRSVQIWFQNRRRAVKVEQQSAIQRAEADARMIRHYPGPVHQQAYGRTIAAHLPPSVYADRRGQSYDGSDGGAIAVKCERPSSERSGRM